MKTGIIRQKRMRLTDEKILILGKIDLLLTALAAIFAWLIPGIIMQLDFRKAKNELGRNHV